MDFQTVLHREAAGVFSTVLASMGLDPGAARMSDCPNPKLGHACFGGALRLARASRRSPADLASDIAARVAGNPLFAAVSPVGGYVNVTFSDAAIAGAVDALASDRSLGVARVPRPEVILVDFGGPNIKPMHVGHLRSLVIGESVRRLLEATGQRVVSDIHLGDWGLPAGMILAEVRRMHPGASWFGGGQGPFPSCPPVRKGDLAEIYPRAAAACKEDPARMEEAHAMLASLQAGGAGPSALWQLLVRDALEGIVASCSRLGAEFDYLLGESDAQHEMPGLLATIEASGAGRTEGRAVLVDVARPADAKPLPPLVVTRQDGTATYAATDLATIAWRRRDLGAERIVYVVDQRQSLHFQQVFRAAAALGLVAEDHLEHVGFGTVNGSDGKPLRTRDGDVMGLDALMDMAVGCARARIVEGGRMPGDPPETVEHAAERIGLAALRIADLRTPCPSGYNLCLDKALSFEGQTGPYLQYSAVRMRSILKRVSEPGPSVVGCDAERNLAIACLSFGSAVGRAAAARAPNLLCDWAFSLAAAYGRFHQSCPVASERDGPTRASRTRLCGVALATLSQALHLLGCEVPEAM